jgi:hypothetical protein
MQRYFMILIMVSVLFGRGFAQVDEIKNASSERSTRVDNRNSVESGFALELANITVNVLIEWQRIKLQTREQNPSLVSLEIIGIAAVQPSSYYIINPRVRANWGIFSTDFRINYLIEEDIDGVKHIRTDDWQILELNILTERTVDFYVGWGFLHEAFNNDEYYNEWTMCLRVKPSQIPTIIQSEYRHSEPRTEINVGVQYPVFRKGLANLYVMGGGTFQQYYSSINVWGIQGGVVMKIY